MAKHARAFSQHTVAQAKHKPKPYELRDGACKGLILRVQPSGAKNWYVVLKTGKRFKIGPAPAITLTDARSRAEQYRLNKGKPPEEVASADAPRIPTLGEFLGPHEKGRGRKAAAAQRSVDPHAPPTYREHFAATHTGRAQQHLNNLNLFEDYYGTRLDLFSKALLDKWIVKRLNEGASKATIKRNIGALKTALRQAVDWELLDANPLGTYRPLALKGADQARTRYLTADEQKRLYKALGKSTSKFRALVMLALNTGARQGQLLKLEWRDVDFKQRELTLRPETAKTKKVNHVPLNARALKALQDLKREQADEDRQLEARDGRPRRRQPTDAVFRGNAGKHWVNVNGLWNDVRREAKLDGFRFHDIRHTFASNLVQQGADLYVVQRLLGHSDPKLTARYAHLAADRLRQAVEKLK